MSAIAAVVSLDGSAVPRSEVERMANILKPYGPDRQKILTRGNAAFVFCLHKLTPEDNFEVQPLLFVDRFVMLFDGRIDNRSELGNILGISTSELHSMPDSVIALRLFDHWGERAFERILGVFAIFKMAACSVRETIWGFAYYIIINRLDDLRWLPFRKHFLP